MTDIFIVLFRPISPNLHPFVVIFMPTYIALSFFLVYAIQKIAGKLKSSIINNEPHGIKDNIKDKIKDIIINRNRDEIIKGLDYLENNIYNFLPHLFILGVILSIVLSIILR